MEQFKTFEEKLKFLEKQHLEKKHLVAKVENKFSLPASQEKKSFNEKIREFLREVEMTLTSRGVEYGEADDSFQRIADVWTFLKKELLTENMTKADVASMMIAMKLCRLETTPNHRDSWLDIAGYACLAAAMEASND